MAIGKDIIAGTVPSDKSIQLFQSIIARSYQRVLSEFDGADLANKARRAAIMRQLDVIVAETHMDLQAWAVTQIPAFYEAGAFAAAKDMVKGGQAIDMYKNFAAIHQEAIAALVNETSADIASAMVGMQKMTQRMINTATRDALLSQVATGKIVGDSRKEISKGIVKELKQSGISAIVDKGGREWDLANYGKMLARTKLTQAHNSGVMMRLSQEGNDLVIVSDHISSCEMCAPWENKVLSVSGKTAGYQTLEQAQAGGLFHPNCRHAISPLPNDQEYLNKSEVWDANSQQYVPFSQLTADQKAVLEKKGAPIPKDMKKPVDGTRKTLSAEFSKIGGKDIQLSDFQANFMHDKGVAFVVNEKTRSLRKQGSYFFVDNRIELNRRAITSAGKDGQHTFFHEMGHAIDFRYKSAAGREISTEAWRGISGDEKIAVAKARFLKSFEKTTVQHKLTEDELDAIWRGSSVKRDITITRKGIEHKGQALIGLPASHIRYLRSNEEIFADGYAQHILNPKEFKKIAPSISSYFETLTKAYGK